MPSEVTETYKCPDCDVVKLRPSKYFQRLQLLHHQHPDFNIVCNIEGCKRSVLSFRTHIYRNHRAALWRHNITLSEENEEDKVDDVEDSEDSQSANENCSSDLSSLLSGLQKHFILNLWEKHLFPKVTQETIVEYPQFVL